MASEDSSESPDQRDDMQSPSTVFRHTAPSENNRSDRSKGANKSNVRSIIILAFIGFAFLLVAVILSPKRGPISTPPFTTLAIITGPGTFVQTAVYEVVSTDKSPSYASPQSDVLIHLNVGAFKVKTNPVPSIRVELFFPSGITPISCPDKKGCTRFKGGQYGWSKLINVQLSDKKAEHIEPIVLLFSVPAQGFGYTTNGLNAAVSLPKIVYTGSQPSLGIEINYHIPASDEYDWSVPPDVSASDLVAWPEQVASGVDLPSLTATGINHNSQTRDTQKTLLAGISIGLGVGALMDALKKILKIT